MQTQDREVVCDLNFSNKVNPHSFVESHSWETYVRYEWAISKKSRTTAGLDGLNWKTKTITSRHSLNSKMTT